MTYFDPGNGEHVVIDGMIVEKDALRVVEALKEYDENIEVLCVRSDSGEINEAPFLICERVGDRLVRIMEAWQLDDRILDRIRLSDTERSNVLVTLGLMQDDAKKKQKARYSDIMGENKELSASIIATKKSAYKFVDQKTGDIVTLYDDRPATRTTGTSTFS